MIEKMSLYGLSLLITTTSFQSIPTRRILSRGFAYVRLNVATEEFFEVENFDPEFDLDPGIDLDRLFNSRQLVRKESNIGKTLENCPSLVLNANYAPLSYMPLSLWHWQDTLRAVLSDKAIALNHYDVLIRSVSMTIQIPSVIVLKRYQRMPETVPIMTRRNVYLRDGFRCQYCLRRFSANALSLDHVYPRSKGGKLTWLNTVSSCLECNHRKGQLLPEDLHRVGMKLRAPPHVPTQHELANRAKNFQRSMLHPHWRDYL